MNGKEKSPENSRHQERNETKHQRIEINKYFISHKLLSSVSHSAGWQARFPQWWPARGITGDGRDNKTKDPKEAVAALAKILEGWAALQAQALVQLAGGGDLASRQTPRNHLPKMTAEDDTQAFLEAFEVAAVSLAQGGMGSAPVTPAVGGSPAPAHSLPLSARGVYQNVRKAVLDRTGYSPEEQRRRFRDLGMADEDRPFAYAQRLTDLARRWLQPEIRSAAGVVEQVVLERFVAGLPAATATWVSCHRPSSLSAAVTLAEDHMVHCPAPPRGEKPEPAPRRKFLPRTAATATARGPSANPPNPSPRWFSQTPGSMMVRPKPQGVPQTSGPEC